MFRQGRISNWRRHKRPRDGQTTARRTRCLSDHSHRSGLEAETCDELRLRKIAGDIKDYDREVKFDLDSYGIDLGIDYYADFVVDEMDGTKEIIDAKGIEFPLFKLKWKLLQIMFRDNPKVKFRIVTR